MYDPSYCPKLRAIEVIPFTYQGQQRLLLRDPFGYTEGAFMLPASLAPILSLMDGSNTLRDIQAAATRLFGRLVMLEEVNQLVASLDESLFLDNERFQALRQRLEEEFRSSPVRPPSHADKAYPGDSERLKEFLDQILAQSERQQAENPTRAVIAPHIDLTCGARGFAEAYRRAHFPEGARIIVLGTGHFLESVLSVLPKDFATPLGPASIDREFIATLEERVGPEVRGHEWGHRVEHSIEFQVIFLRYLLGDRFRLVPVLCGGLETITEKDQTLLEDFITVLRELVDEETYFVAGVDFCHLGVRYGDLVPAGEGEKKQALQYDRKLLERILAIDPQGFYELIMRVENRYRVCGFTPLYVLLRVLEGRPLKGEILYQEAVDFGPGSIVSFAAAALYDQT